MEKIEEIFRSKSSSRTEKANPDDLVKAIIELRDEMRNMETRLDNKIDGLRDELKEFIQEMRKELIQEIRRLS